MNLENKTKSIWINGIWKDFTGKTETIYNPATLEPITEVDYGGEIETAEAIQAASKAFSSWSETTGRERSRILYKAAELMTQNAERLGEILTLEQGKPLTEAIGEVKVPPPSYYGMQKKQAEDMANGFLPPANRSDYSLYQSQSE